MGSSRGGQNGHTAMFWATFGYSKRTESVAMRGDPAAARGGGTARRYIEVLEEHLSTVLVDDSLFIHDNSRVRTAITV